MLMSYNSPRFNGDVSKTIAEREDLCEKLSVELESSLEDMLSTSTSSNASSIYEDESKEEKSKEEEMEVNKFSWFNHWFCYFQSKKQQEEKDILKKDIERKNGQIVDRKAPGSAGVKRMQQYFMKILPPNTPHAVVSLQPAKPLPWKLIGVGVGATISITAMLLIAKSRRSK